MTRERSERGRAPIRHAVSDVFSGRGYRRAADADIAREAAAARPEFQAEVRRLHERFAALVETHRAWAVEAGIAGPLDTATVAIGIEPSQVAVRSER